MVAVTSARGSFEAVATLMAAGWRAVHPDMVRAVIFLTCIGDDEVPMYSHRFYHSDGDGGRDGWKPCNKDCKVAELPPEFLENEVVELLITATDELPECQKLDDYFVIE